VDFAITVDVQDFAGALYTHPLVWNNKKGVILIAIYVACFNTTMTVHIQGFAGALYTHHLALHHSGHWDRFCTPVLPHLNSNEVKNWFGATLFGGEHHYLVWTTKKLS
jgi:hypothetical protein